MAAPQPTDPSWVVSHDYEGPNRRQRAAWFKPKARLDDVAGDCGADSESADTLLRRVSLFGALAGAAREKRAQFVCMLETLVEKGRAGGHVVWPDIVAACARYVRAVGADGTLDDPLVNEALLAAQRAHAENGHGPAPDHVIARLDAAARRG
jgi:hypothetical protein